MHTVSVGNQIFSLELQDILYLLRSVLLASLERWGKYQGTCQKFLRNEKIREKCKYADV